ncbi:type 2 lanthipeptide synthetase LanM family protein [Bacillus xiapuensis]|uniref:type 2 lanthipeptide synthetase LanM family protein n=1 Tax=Bacillus xiapuensis TaxID=2014075 RepID=UPI000C23E4D7|nr:type 2 lanthipeptide synthetase LanM family protein [Bacillus xiapuensis]
MKTTTLAGIDWNGATSLKERAIPKTRTTDELSQKRFNRWKEFVESDKEISLKEVLDTHYLNEELLLNFLAAPEIEVLDDSDLIDWKSVLNDIYSPKFEEVVIPDLEDVLFVNFVKPFVKVGIGRLDVKLNELNITEKIKCLIKKEAHDSLIRNLAESLAALCSRTIILELNVARVSGHLKGETPEERFQYYNNNHLNNKEYTSTLLTEYVVLARLLATKTIYWINNVGDLYQRILSDNSLLEEEFNLGKPLGPVIKIETGSTISDSHNKGKTVTILHFQYNLKIVYKPRSLKVDQVFNRFIKSINSELRYRLKTVKTLDRKEYGWTEFICPSTCHSEEEIKRFYWRIGSYLSILYSINAVDFHHQNLIANGEYPILIDLESLLHNSSTYTDDSALSRAHTHIEKSVLRIGLLPRKIGSKQGLEGIDLSGLGAQEGQVSPHKTTVIEDRNKDTIRIVEKNYSIPVSHHRPLLNGKNVKVVDYEDAILEGFKETYNFLMENRDQVYEKVKEFKVVPVRQILRGTSRYANLLRISLHPNFMRDGLDRDMILDKLWLDTKLNPNLKAVVHSEQYDMYSGDIPYFLSYPGSTSIIDSRGNEIPNFFKNNALDDIQNKFNGLNPTDREEQISFIQTAMLVLKDKTKKNTSLVSPPQPYKEIEFLQEAMNIADFLDQRGIRGKQGEQTDISWIGSFVDNKREDQFKISPTNSTLYEGIGGISLFFAYLGYISKKEKYTKIAQEALVPILSNLPTLQDLGAFGGIGSSLYLLDHLSALWKDNSLIMNAFLGCEEKLRNLIPIDKNNDILTGVSGCAIVLLNLYKRLQEPKLLDLIDLCGERLIMNAIPMERGIGWKVEANPVPSSGFSHGASGIVWSLYEIYKVTGKVKYKNAADQGLDYEKTLYIPEKKNWADLKLESGQSRNEDFVAWCNGAAGIGLSRFLLMPLIEDINMKREIKEEALIAVDTTCKNGFGNNHSLCHGDLGNLDILMSGIDYCESLLEKTSELSQMILHDIKNRGWISGFEKQNESPSLMMGLAGIGLGLLKIYEPNKIPSVLKLQSPIELDI